MARQSLAEMPGRAAKLAALMVERGAAHTAALAKARALSGHTGKPEKELPSLDQLAGEVADKIDKFPYAKSRPATRVNS